MSTQKLSILNLNNEAKACLYSTASSGAQIVELGEFLSIGRDPENTLELADPFVSSRHARIEKKSDGYLIRDLRSQNGTYVNELRVMEAYLNVGDKIRMGEREFVFHAQVEDDNNDTRLVSKNAFWSKQLQSVPIFSRTDLPVLLLGSSGTGKEVLARLVHDSSPRQKNPFVSVNCSALSESLIESELFGHVKGSFTGATHDRKGAFEAARGGTLFLDEIGDLPLSLQPKLLRALENKEIRPVGSDKNISTDVRIVAATHKNLQKMVSAGQFRADLFYRLHVIKILIPELRDRMEDFENILYGFAREMRVRFSHDAIQTLKKYTWPGNIRELKNMVSRASALFPKDQIQPEHIQLLLDNCPSGTDVIIPNIQNRPMLKELERELIIQKLIQHRGNQRKAAADLGMPKSTLHDRIKNYGIVIQDINFSLT